MKSSKMSYILLFLFTFALNSNSLLAQPTPAKEGQPEFRILKGYRHGVNYFKINYLKETTPLVEGEWDFKHYHTTTEVNSFLEKWADEYPDIFDLYVGGTSLEGRDIMQVTLTNKSTGKDTDKPAMLIDANRHAGEVTAAESTYWLLHHMITNYGKDDEITSLIDNFAFYFRIQNNPDGSDLYLKTAQTLRSTTRPMDNDGDGLMDEDAGEDLDGDGFVRQMRIKVEKGKGQFVIDERDPKGRLMKRAEPGEGIYNIMSEGIDNDGDGRINEDGIGGLDLHRNYPENWRPMPGRDRTGRGWTQNGAGEYPLSEPETRSLVIFTLEHPNISIANSMDTTVPMHLRPPSTSKSEERMYPEDLALYKMFDKKGMEITNYPWAGDVYWDYATRNRPNAKVGNPLFGHGPDYGYFYYGSIWYGDELWNGGNVGDYNEDGVEDELDRINYNDNELSKSRFQEWTKVNHPEFGEVEVGGWNPKFWRQNPPPELLEEWAEKQARFNLMLASHLPKVVMSEPKIKEGKNNEYTIEFELENIGGIPTALLQAQLVKIVRPDVVTLVLPRDVYRPTRRGRRFFGGSQPEEEFKNKVTFLDDKENEAPNFGLDRIINGEKKKVKFKVKLDGISGTKATLKFSSTRGGVIEKEIYIGKK